jgi:Mg2+/Co2+ transporter CorC
LEDMLGDIKDESDIVEDQEIKKIDDKTLLVK